MSGLPPSTPVIIGVGQTSERLDDADYRARSPVELAADAARAALADTDGDPARLKAELDTVVATRLFEESSPFGRSPLGRCDNLPRSVAARLGADPRRAVLEVTGGQSPQHLVTEFAAKIAAGRADVVLLTGAEAQSTVAHLSRRPENGERSFTESVPGPLDDRGWDIDDIVGHEEIAHGLTSPLTVYSLFENARRARFGLGRAAYVRTMGELFAPFTDVAAGNPHAASPVARTAAELVTVDDDNRLLAEPYLTRLVARDKVNQGAAVLLTSVATAERLGVPADRFVYLHGHADLLEPRPAERPDLDRSPAAAAAVEQALADSGVSLADLAFLDLYSCFPIAVFAVCDALGLAPDDPRGLTVTGGLPYFGGPGNNYSMHAIAETVARCRRRPGRYGLVGANGGLLTKYSAGVYSTGPVPWRPGSSAAVQQRLDARPRVEVARDVTGAGTIEAWTVTRPRAGRPGGIVVGRDGDGRRFVATGRDDALVDALLQDEVAGLPVRVRAGEDRNEVTLA